MQVQHGNLHDDTVIKIRRLLMAIANYNMVGASMQIIKSIANTNKAAYIR